MRYASAIVLSAFATAIAAAASDGAEAAELPASAWLVWQRGATQAGAPRQIWLGRADGTDARLLTNAPGKMPTWSPDGRWISYHRYQDDGGHLIRPDGGGDRKVCDGVPSFWLQRKGELVCRSGDRYQRVDPASGRRQLLFDATDFSRLQGASVEISSVGPNQRFAVGWSDRYRRRYRGDNGVFKSHHTAVLLDLEERDRLYAVGPGCEPILAPSGKVVYHVSAEGPTRPDIVRVPVASILRPDYVERRHDLGYRAEVGLAESEWGHTYFPRVAVGKEASWLTYSATTAEAGEDRACHQRDTCRYQVFVHLLGSGSRERIQITDNGDSNLWPHLFVGDLP